MFNKEPALAAKVLEEIIRAAVPMALIFGWVHWSDAQTGTVLFFIGVVAGSVSLLLTRSQVVPTEKANAQIETAILMPATATVEQVIAKQEKQSQ